MKYEIRIQDESGQFRTCAAFYKTRKGVDNWLKRNPTTEVRIITRRPKRERTYVKDGIATTVTHMPGKLFQTRKQWKRGP